MKQQKSVTMTRADCIFCVHLHVLPRFQGDSIKIDADWSIQPCCTELNESAPQISRAYAQTWLTAA
jgi:diadenosine tetraphosphate (Ap4A) HIT family hydrolase